MGSTRNRGVMGHYVDASKTIYIDLEEIYTKSHGIPASNYDLLLEVIMHERLHAEHEHNKPNVIVEKKDGMKPLGDTERSSTRNLLLSRAADRMAAQIRTTENTTTAYHLANETDGDEDLGWRKRDD